jgi:hypothetical protein
MPIYALTFKLHARTIVYCVFCLMYSCKYEKCNLLEAKKLLIKCYIVQLLAGQENAGQERSRRHMDSSSSNNSE